MPSRHISPESFDAILSDLGDDPAIPDPHGIRKTIQPTQSPQSRMQNETASSSLKLGYPLLKPEWQKLGFFISIGASLSALFIAFFTYFELLNLSSDAQSQEIRSQITQLQKNLALLQENFEQEQDELYEEIHKLEVSIHSLKKSQGQSKVNSKAPLASEEIELNKWRFLGATQIGGSHRVFFHTGKKRVAAEKSDLVLGNWRVGQIEKRFATVTHPSGKILVIQSSKSE
jgi:hypothetical protein